MARKRVRELMSSPVVAVTPDTSYRRILRTLVGRGIGAVPVVGADGTVLGVVSETDLLPKEELTAVAGHLRPLLERRADRRNRVKAAANTAADLMSGPAITVPDTATVPEAARLLDDHHISQLPVVDESGHLVGILARSDVLRVFLRRDDDIRGEVIREVIGHALWQDPADVTVDVARGVVTLGGRLELRSLIPLAVRLTAAVDGVVDVVDELAYARDDTAWRERHGGRTPRRRV